MAKTKIQSLVSIEAARSAWDKIITTTPVVLAVVATILAGLSSSEMGLAQYHRALSAQNQSKAADQWAFYQAKRSRAEGADNTRSLLALMSGTAVATPKVLTQLGKLAEQIDAPLRTTQPSDSNFDAGTIDSAVQAFVSDPKNVESAKYLAAGVPTVQDKPMNEPVVESAMARIAKNPNASNIVKNALDQSQIDDAMATAQLNANNFDAATKPITTFFDQLTTLADKVASAPGPNAPPTAPPTAAKSLAAQATAARLSWDSRRNIAEAKYNQTVAQILEVQVAYSGQDSDRHRDRSKFFFYGMLAAQAGVTISTLSLAVKNRNALWVIAALVGMAAVAYAAYIYVFT